jgi:Pyrimidine dimer DNA glycosylase
MNIFALDANPIIAAKLHLDKHVVKMPLETAQILCTVQRKYGNENVRYKSTHVNHPCTIWAGESVDNYNWLVALGLALCEEYTYRYGKIHACEEVIRSVGEAPNGMPQVGLTQFALAMPDDVKSDDVIMSYREYYRVHKQHIAKWTKRFVPSFMQLMEV